MATRKKPMARRVMKNKVISKTETKENLSRNKRGQAAKQAIQSQTKKITEKQAIRRQAAKNTAKVVTKSAKRGGKVGGLVGSAVVGGMIAAATTASELKQVKQGGIKMKTSGGKKLQSTYQKAYRAGKEGTVKKVMQKRISDRKRFSKP